MLKGCGLLLLAWAALAVVEWQALIRTSGQESYLQVVLLAQTVVLGLSGGWAVLGALRLARAARRPLPEWRDGALVCANGRLSTTGALRTAPLSGTPAVLSEYEVTGEVQHLGDASDHKLAQGMGMTPCVIHTPAGPVSGGGRP